METSDRGSCLSDIARHQGRSIVSVVVDIQDIPHTFASFGQSSGPTEPEFTPKQSLSTPGQGQSFDGPPILSPYPILDAQQPPHATQ